MQAVICGIIKNEHDYLLEWLDYHLELGFVHIFLYEDRGSLSHIEKTKNYDNITLTSLENDFFDFLYVDEKRKQTTLYNWFISEMYNKYDFVTFIDIDEFITLENGLTLQDILNEKKNLSSFKIYWKMYNANFHIEKQNKVLDSYTSNVTDILPLESICPKTFVNLKKPLPMVSPHNTLFVNGKCDEEGWEILYDKIWINHYFTKSWDDWCDRFLTKGDLIPGNRNIWDFFVFNPEMEFLKDKLMERFWERKDSISSIQPQEKITFIHVFEKGMIVNNCFKEQNTYHSYQYNILAYSVSCLNIKNIGCNIILYTDEESKDCLSFLPYDNIIIAPKNTDVLTYAISQEGKSSYFLHGDCFIQNKTIVDFLKRNTADITVFSDYVQDDDIFFKDNIYNTINIFGFLSPELINNGKTYDTGILNFQNIEIKNAFLTEYDRKLQLYENSKLKKLWETTKYFNVKKIIFNETLYEVCNNNDIKINILSEVKLKNNYKEQRINKLCFLGIFHVGDILILNSSIITTLDEILKNISADLHREALQIINNFSVKN